MTEMGLDPVQAMEVFWATLQSASQSAPTAEGALARTVYRLEQGLWDTEERAARAVRHAQYGPPPRGNGKTPKGNGADTIAKILQENGVFPENAARIAAMMAEKGLNPRRAQEVFQATLRSTCQSTPTAEQAIALAVYRLEQGLWDTEERVTRATRHAQYRSSPHSDAVKLPEREVRGELEEIWQATLNELQLEMTRATFETLLRGSRPIAREGGSLVVQVASEYARAWLEARLRPVVTRALARQVGSLTDVRFVAAG